MTALFYGANLAGQWQMAEPWAAAARAGYFVDDDGAMSGVGHRVGIGSGTLTLSWTPTPNVLLRFENRADVASTDVFHKGATGTATSQFTSLLGVVVTTAKLR